MTPINAMNDLLTDLRRNKTNGELVQDAGCGSPAPLRAARLARSNSFMNSPAPRPPARGQAL